MIFFGSPGSFAELNEALKNHEAKDLANLTMLRTILQLDLKFFKKLQ
jgi:hypothetical protein